jgi:hypothetical protein
MSARIIHKLSALISMTAGEQMGRGGVTRISSLISYRVVPKVKHLRGSGRGFGFERV